MRGKNLPKPSQSALQLWHPTFSLRTHQLNYCKIIKEYTNGNPSFLRSAKDPITNVITGKTCSRECTREFPNFDYHNTTLLRHCNKLFTQPIIISIKFLSKFFFFFPSCVFSGMADIDRLQCMHDEQGGEHTLQVPNSMSILKTQIRCDSYP